MTATAAQLREVAALIESGYPGMTPSEEFRAAMRVLPPDMASSAWLAVRTNPWLQQAVALSLRLQALRLEQETYQDEASQNQLNYEVAKIVYRHWAATSEEGGR